MIVRCPAKVNLFLSVGRPDATGYHPIRTVFQAIGLYDELSIEPSDVTKITCDWEGLPPVNTLSKTVGLLREIINLEPVHIHLKKAIPSQAGLGGGSSDAAGLLQWVQEVYRGQYSQPEMDSVSPAIGADVPFFLVGGRASAEGYGEILTPLPDPEIQNWYVVCQPTNVLCSTPYMYRQLDEKEYEWKEFTTDGRLYNDFERVAPCESLDLIETLQLLGCDDAALAGSGSAVFGVCESEEMARLVEEKLLSRGLELVWCAPGLTRKQSILLNP